MVCHARQKILKSDNDRPLEPARGAKEWRLREKILKASKQRQGSPTPKAAPSHAADLDMATRSAQAAEFLKT